MEKSEIKAKIFELMSSEIDGWLEKKDSITSGYEYETQLVEVARKLNLILVEQSIGAMPKSRNKKNCTPYLVK